MRRLTKIRLWNYFLGTMMGLSIGLSISSSYWLARFTKLNRRIEAIRLQVENVCGKLSGVKVRQ